METLSVTRKKSFIREAEPAVVSRARLSAWTPEMAGVRSSYSLWLPVCCCCHIRSIRAYLSD